MIGLGSILILGFLGMVIWAKTGTRYAKEAAKAALQSSTQVRIIEDEWIQFEPGATTEVGLIFYPGGLVEAQAYAPILRQISEEGVFVVKPELHVEEKHEDEDQGGSVEKKPEQDFPKKGEVG